MKLIQVWSSPDGKLSGFHYINFWTVRKKPIIYERTLTKYRPNAGAQLLILLITLSTEMLLCPQLYDFLFILLGQKSSKVVIILLLRNPLRLGVRGPFCSKLKWNSSCQYSIYSNEGYIHSWFVAPTGVNIGYVCQLGRQILSPCRLHTALVWSQLLFSI